MKAKVYAYLLVFVLLVAALWLANSDHAGINTTERKQNANKRKNANRNNRGFERKLTGLEYTSHARCRMKCRRITQEEVKDIMKNGTINYRKSDPDDKPCPTYALEGYTNQDNQHVRIVFAQCKSTTRVVTCIDLDSEVECDCK